MQSTQTSSAATAKRKVRPKKVVKKELKENAETVEKRATQRVQAEKRVQLEKRIFHLQQVLIDTNVSENGLKEAAAFFLPQHYEDVVTERAVDLCCGYPCCENKLKHTKGPVPKYKLSLATKRVYDNSELMSYCGTDCLIASKLFSSQLLNVPLHLRTKEDLETTESIKFKNEIADTNPTTENAKTPAANAIAQMRDIIMPYGAPDSLDQIKGTIAIVEREDVSPPSLDFTGASQLRLHNITNTSKPNSNMSNLQPSSLLSSQQTTTSSKQESSTSSTLPVDTVIQGMSNLQLNRPLKQSSMRKHRQKEKEKKGVQFTLPLPSREETIPDRDNGDMSESGGEGTSDEDAGSLYGIQDSSDEEFDLSLSSFGLIWTSLENWKTPATLSFLHGKEDENVIYHPPSDEGNHIDEDNAEEDAEEMIERLPDASQNSQRRRTLSSSILQQISNLKSALQLNFNAEHEITELLSTFSMVRVIPSFSSAHWRTIALVFIQSISWRNPRLQVQLKDSLQQCIRKYKINPDEFKVFVDVYKM